MGKKHKTGLKILFLTFIGLWAVALVVILAQNLHIPVLEPKGVIGAKERDLMNVATILMLLVVVPVFVLTAYISLKYRSTNLKAKYHPEWDHSRKLETLWWAFPFSIIMILAVITWQSSHDLDPHKPLRAETKPINVQVVALQWKWLFIYPEQNIASVNYLQFPEDTPVNFQITSDGPMNSFWIPELGGQIYAMSGMSTRLHLMADEPGSFTGSSANISGAGFADMKFTAIASSEGEFNSWVRSIKQSTNQLNMDQYDKLAEPNRNVQIESFASTENDLYMKIIHRFIDPAHKKQEEEPHAGTTHH